MSIPFVDLKTQYQNLKEDINQRMQSVMENTAFILGDEVSLFEKKFAEFTQSKHCIGVSSGTDALQLALRVLEIGPGDEVITVANTFIATSLAISYVGATPVLVDCDKEDYTIDVEGIKKAITDKTKAIIPVHLYGQPARMKEIKEIATEHGLYIIEDACQAHGASLDGISAGSFGDIGCFSFYPGKNLGGYGDGGAITTNDEHIAEKLRMLREYGQKKKYYHSSKGMNNRLDALQAAILNVKLDHLADWNESRRKAAALYTELLSDIPQIETPHTREGAEHVFHLYVIRHPERDKLLTYLHEKEVYAGIHYPVPIHLQEAYVDLDYHKGSFPITEAYADTILSLPLFPEITEEQIKEVVSCIKEFCAKEV